MGVKLAVQTVFNALDHVTGTMRTMEQNGKRYSRAMQKHGLDIGASWRSLRGVIGTVSAALTTGLAAKAIGDFAARGDDIVDVSKRLGLSTQAWQEFAYAANQADMTSEDLTSVMQKMNNNLGQLKQGTGALYTNLKKTNPQLALQLKNAKNSEAAFSMLMDAIAKEADIQKRAALAQAAFGKSGQNIIDMAADLNRKRAEARASGSIMSEEDAKRAAELHNNLLRLKSVGMGLANSVLGKIVEKLQPLLDRFSAWVDKNKELIAQKVGDAIDWIANAAKTAYEIFDKWSPVILGVVGAMVAMNIAMKVAAIISVVSKAISIASAVMAMFRAGASLATVAQWAFNAAMAANPIMLVIIAISALIAIVVLIVKNWDKVKVFFTALWEGIKAGAAAAWKFIKMGFFTLADIILTIYGNLVKGVMMVISKIGGALGFDMTGINSAISALDKLQTDMRAQSAFGGGGEKTPVSPNTGVISSNTSTTRNVRVGVAFANTPAGTEIKQQGSAPEVDINMGPTMEWGMAGL